MYRTCVRFDTIECASRFSVLAEEITGLRVRALLQGPHIYIGVCGEVTDTDRFYEAIRQCEGFRAVLDTSTKEFLFPRDD